MFEKMFGYKYSATYYADTARNKNVCLTVTQCSTLSNITCLKTKADLLFSFSAESSLDTR